MKILAVTNKTTQLLNSHTDLNIICSQEHKQKRAVSTDISFFGNSAPNTFAQIHKSTDLLQIWRVRADKDGKDNFDYIKKAVFPGIQAVAGGKGENSFPEFAVGHTNGHIKIVELTSPDLTTKTEFLAGPSKASVVSLDYSNCGGYLSSVYENGTINIFGLTTKIKSDSILLDKDSSLARFHPNKRFLLAVGSFKGSVTIYDIATKKIYFQEKRAHEAPCRDVAMCEDHPELLFTCGCDSVVNVFDSRKKKSAVIIKSYCGFNTISPSKCGNFFVAGNLKGDVMTYDIRDHTKVLKKKKLDSEVITRVAFLPSWNKAEDNSFSLTAQKEKFELDELPEPPEVQDEFEMADIIGFQKGRISEFDMSCSSRVSVIRPSEGGRPSDSYVDRMANAVNDLSYSSDTSSPVHSEVSKRYKRDSITKRRSSFMPPALQLIREEHCDKENQSLSLNSPDLESGPRFSSTPAPPVKPVEDSVPLVSHEQSEEIIDVDALDCTEPKENPSEERQTLTTIVPGSILHGDLKKEFQGLQANLEDQIKFQIESLNFDLSGRHFQMQTFVANQNRRLQEKIERMETCMEFLLDDDAKINRIVELQVENRQLKVQVNNLMNQMDSQR